MTVDLFRSIFNIIGKFHSGLCVRLPPAGPPLRSAGRYQRELSSYGYILLPGVGLRKVATRAFGPGRLRLRVTPVMACAARECEVARR